MAAVCSESQYSISNTIHYELEEKVVLIDWAEQIFNHVGFEWYPIDQTVDIHDQFEQARLSVAPELHLSNYVDSEWLTWNFYGWSAFVLGYIESATKSAVISMKNVRFGPCGVVLEILNPAGKYYSKASHPCSAEPVVSKLLSSALQQCCDEVFHVNESLNCFLTKDHGSSLFPMMGDEVEEEYGRLLASIQVSSITLVDQLLECGAFDTRPQNFRLSLSELTRNSISYVRR